MAGMEGFEPPHGGVKVRCDIPKDVFSLKPRYYIEKF